MTESESSQRPEYPELPDNLPPVEPPSAKIIAQLFLVPGVIVMVIACAWLLLTRMTTSNQDWRALVRGVETRNEHERWRSAFGLAQLLQSEASLPASQQQLVTNPELAEKLSLMFREELKQPAKNDDDTQKRVYLAATLGLFKTPDVVLPALLEGMPNDQGREVRSATLRSISSVLGNSTQPEKTLDNAQIRDAVIEASADPDLLVRGMATYTLGLLPLAGVQSRLETLLKDEDENIRSNAALALVRHKSLLAVPQLKKMLSSATPSASKPATQETLPDTSSQPDLFSHHLQVTNALTGVSRLIDVLSPDEKQELQKIIEKLASSDSDPGIRVQARDLLVTLQAK